MSKGFIDVKLSDGTIKRTLCKWDECMLGGLAIKKPNSNLIFCSEGVQEQNNSLLKFSPECLSQIGPYHSVNQNDKEIFDFLYFVNNTKPTSDNLSSLQIWVNANLQGNKPFQKFKTFLALFMSVKNVLNDEFVKRKNHLLHCVCLSNSGHTKRLKIIEKLFLNMEQIYTQQVVPQFNRTLSTPFTDILLCKYFLDCKYDTKNINSLFYEDIFHQFIKDNFNYINFDENGLFSFFSRNNFYNDLLQLKVYHPTLENDLQVAFTNKLDNLLSNSLNTIDNYNRDNVTFISCVEVDNQDNFQKVGVNYSLLSQNFDFNYNIKVDPIFLEKHIEAKHKSALYKTCFIGLVKYHQSIMTQICRNLDSLSSSLDKELIDFLKYLCGLIPNIGDHSQLTNKDIISITSAIRSYPLIGKAYTTFLQSNPPPKGTKTTGNFIIDCKRIPLVYLIDFFVFYEKIYNDFYNSFYEPPTKKQKKFRGK